MIKPRTIACETPELRGLERTRFFGQQLVGPDDLTQDQTYFREKLRRHNRLLHGWGIVCGACVRRGHGPCDVVIDPGYILGPYGDEIVIDRDATVNVCKLGADEETGCCGDHADPWCGERQDCSAGVFYLAIRYSECHARPVRALGASCGGGCDHDHCEYSRTRDSFSIGLLTDLPSGYTTPIRQPGMDALIPCSRGRQRPCPPCPEDPWVILADIEIGPDCTVRRVDCFRHRRYVLSFANFFLICPPTPGLRAGPPDIVAPMSGVAAARALALAGGMRDLVDIDRVSSTEPPRAMIAFHRPDGTAALFPVHFAVGPETSVADLLEHFGDRLYYDPGTDSVFALREVVDAAGADPATTVGGLSGLLGLFEGQTLDLAALRDPRRILEATLDPSALGRLETEAAATPERALELPATNLAGVSPRSRLGRNIAEMTIADIVATDRQRFIADATASVARPRLEEEGRRAAALWEAARRIARSVSTREE